MMRVSLDQVADDPGVLEISVGPFDPVGGKLEELVVLLLLVRQAGQRLLDLVQLEELVVGIEVEVVHVDVDGLVEGLHGKRVGIVGDLRGHLHEVACGQQLRYLGFQRLAEALLASHWDPVVSSIGVENDLLRNVFETVQVGHASHDLLVVRLQPVAVDGGELLQVGVAGVERHVSVRLENGVRWRGVEPVVPMEPHAVLVAQLARAPVGQVVDEMERGESGVERGVLVQHESVQLEGGLRQVCEEVVVEGDHAA